MDFIMVKCSNMLVVNRRTMPPLECGRMGIADRFLR